jgi:hypothetical protein
MWIGGHRSRCDLEGPALPQAEAPIAINPWWRLAGWPGAAEGHDGFIDALHSL